MRKFTYDVFHQITPPTLILSTKYHKHLGTIQNVGDNIANDFNMASHQEISFDVYKTMDGEECGLWDQIVDFKYVFVPEHNEYYEISVSIDDADNTIKHVVGVSAGEVELSQRYLRDFHCNDETDINFTPIYKVDNGVVKKVNENGVVDFEYDTDDSEKLPDQDGLIKATVLYRPVYSTDSDYLKMKKRRASLLYRVLKDKCPDWSVGHIDSTLANIQRTFTADGSTIYDFLTNTVATELGCLFTFDSVNRKINVYDLKSTCEDCGFRGEFIDKCPKCGSQNFIRGYGAWKNVYVSPENTALQITVDGDSDSVKNCFKIAAGDDLMTATVRNINPNNSSYIYRFSDDMKADMPSELLDKLEAYETYYNSKVADYEDVTWTWYNALDKQMYYQTTMMPKTPIPNDTTAKEQLDIIMNTTPLNVAVEKISSLIDTTANNAVEGYIRVLIDPRYKVEVSEGTLSANDHTWQGYITVTSLGGVNDEGEEDTATSTTKKTVYFNEDYENFLEQKVQKSLDRTDASFMTIYDIEDDNEFKDALKLYSVDSLMSFSNSYQSILEVLIQQGLTKEYTDLYGAQLYNELYKPYYDRKQMITDEIKNGEAQAYVKHWKKVAHNADGRRQRIQAKLNLEKFLGEDLYKIFVLYLREDTYTNSNYISDGLDSAEIINKAMDLLAVAQSELIKASELQFTLTGQLNNFLNTEEFADFKDEFEIGDYIICKADDKIYRLRITNVNYAYNDPENISITFSNVVRGGNFMSDVASVLSKASSMATSYNYVAHQANQGKDANNVVSQFKNTGLDSKLYNILAGTNQDVTIDSHGITAREYDDVANDYKNEQLIVTSHCLAFTDDGWANVSLSLGRHTYTYWDETNQQMVTTTGYGLNSQFVESGNIHGSQIIAGHIYSEDFDGVNGAHFDLNNGKFTFADGKLKFDGTKLYVQGDVMTGSIIDHATITDSTINVNSNFIVAQNGNVTLNGTVGGTAWQSKQDKLTVNPTGTAADTIHKLKIDNVIYDFDGGSSVIPNPSGTATDILRKLEVDGDIYSIEGSGNATYDELMDDEYEALSDDDKNNDTIYFAKTLLEEPFDGTPTKIGEFYKIDNSKLNPDYVWNNEVKWFFNGYDAYYILSPLGLWDSNFQPPYNHASDQADTRNSLIVEGMPVDTCYVITTKADAGLGGKYTFFIPKEIIDDGIGCMTRNGFYSTQDFTFYVSSNWGDWNNPADYSAIASFTFDHTQGIHHLSCDQYTTTALTDFTNMPWLAGYVFVDGGQALQDSLDAYLANRSYSDFPNFYNVNYFNYNDIMPPKYTGTIYLNSINYTGSKISANPVGTATDTLNTVKIDGTIYVVPDGTTADGTSYDNTDSGLTATNVQDAIDEISVLEGLANVDITSPTDGQTLVYDSQNQEWVNASGGGGTTVIPNPVGEPTDELETVQIGNTIFSIPGSGGGGGSNSGLVDDTIYSSATDNTIMTLSNSITNYDYIWVMAGYSQDGQDVKLASLFNASDLENAIGTAERFGISNDTSYTYFSVDSLTQFSKYTWQNRAFIQEIHGLKLGGGAGFQSTLLWDYVDDNNGTIPYGTYTETLRDDINNYNVIILEFASAMGDLTNVNWDSTVFVTLDVEALNNAWNPNKTNITSFGERSSRFYIHDNVLQKTIDNQGDTNGLIRVYGVKFGGGGTNVEANPTDTPTDTLNTIRIGDTVYDIAGTGGGGSVYKETTLWSGSDSSTMQLSESFENYDAVLFIGNVIESGTNYEVTNIWSVQDLKSHINDGCRLCAVANDAWYVYISISDNTTIAKHNQNVLYISEIRGLKFGGSGSGTNAEIIPITAGNDTTTRTFTFDKTPKFVKFYWGDPVISGGWATDADIVWGQTYMNYRSKAMVVATSQVDGGIASITYGVDNKSFTITGANAFGAMNTSNGTGYMYVDYGGGSGISQKDITDMTWTQIISQAGGAWSTATTIPSSATHVAVVVDYDNKAYMPQTFKLSDWDKYADTLNHSLVEWGFDWKVGSSYDTVQIEYDSVNHTIRTYAGYSGLTLKTYALS